MGYKELLSSIDCKFVVIIEDDFKQIEYKKERALYDITRMAIDDRRQYLSEIETVSPVLHEILSKFLSLFDKCVADGLFCREIDGLFCRSSPDIIVRRRCVLSHKRRGWLQPSPSFRYSRNLALQDELYHPVINNGPAVLVCVDKRLGTGPVNQSRDAG